MGEMGFEAGDFSGIEIEVWPENWQVVCLFQSMQTQWVYDQGCRTGLNYVALKTVEKRIGIRKKDRKQVFRKLQTLEIEFLNAVAEFRKAKKQ